MRLIPFLASWLTMATGTGILRAQTPPIPSPPGLSNSAADQSMGAPLPNKVLGQMTFTTKYAIAGEITDILQSLVAFRSPYSGASSLQSRNETELTDTYSLYLGARPTPRFEVYLNPEMALGNGVSDGMGLAGYSNGDLIGQPSLPSDPYLARFFVRWRVPLQRRNAHKLTQDVQPAPNLIGGSLPASRLVITAGKFAISDHFDTNSFANNARNQFLNNAFINNLAYDKAGDTRGYDFGLMANLITPRFALRLGTIAMPTTAGGPNLTYHLGSEHSEQMELELHPSLQSGANASPLIIRLLAYRNEGTMGSYQDALSAKTARIAPDITTVRHHGAAKYGFGINFEQAIGDGGASGIFGRLGWNDGHTESFSYAEADRFLSFGGQLSGVHWRRSSDILGAGLAQSNLSGAHKAYLEAGGVGLSLGDGRLNYGPEQIAEMYYSYQLSHVASLSPDYQFILHPGFNRDRGPVSLLSLRLHLTF